MPNPDIDRYQAIMNERQEAAKQRAFLREMMVDFYDGNQTAKPEYLRRWGFLKETTLPKDFSTGLTKRVIDRVSMVYKRPPGRYLVNDAGDPLENDPIVDFFNDNPLFHFQWKRAERLHNLLNNVIIRFVYHKERKQFFFFIHTDYIPDFGELDDEEYNNLYPIAYDIPLPNDIYGKSDVRDWYLHISDTEMYAHDGKTDKREPLPGYDDIDNPYDIMPIIDFSMPGIDEYWTSGMKTLVEFHRMYNIYLMNFFHGTHFKMFPKQWLTGYDMTQAQEDVFGNKTIEWGPTDIPNLPEGAQAGILDATISLQDALEALRILTNMELQNYGLGVHYKESGNPASGFALIVSNMELLEKRETDIDFYQIKEAEIKPILAAMSDEHGLPYDIPVDSTMKTDFVEPKFPLEPQEERAQWDWEIKKGFKSLENYLMEKEGLSEDEAKAKIETNREANRSFRGLLQTATEPETPFGENGQ